MRRPLCFGALVLWLCAADLVNASGPVTINEVLYHSASGSRTEEFLELHNPTDTPVDLTAWQLTDGVRFLFPPETSIEAHGFLVVASSPEKLKAGLARGVAVVGPYEKKLSHKADRVELRNPAGARIDAVVYEDDKPWPKEADGKGSSLERVNASAPGDDPSAWRASAAPGGTPGQVNSVFDARAALWLGGAAHAPMIPTSRETIALSVDAIGAATPVRVRAEWWIDGEGNPKTLALAPDAANPRRWTGAIGPFPNKTIVEYRFHAEGGAGGADVSETWFPSPRKGEPAGHLLQVDDDPVTATRASYRLLVRKKDWDELHSRAAESNVLLPGTFIADGREWQRVGLRYRGSSSRIGPGRKSYRIRFPRWDTYLDRRDHAFNASYFEAQYLAMKLFAKAGLEAPNVDLVGMSINGAWTGYYCWTEEIDEDFARRHFNNPEEVRIWEGKVDADLAFKGTDPKNYAGYEGVAPDKDLNPAPIIGLCDSLRARDDMKVFQYSAEAAIDVDEWIRFFAANALIANIEGALWTFKGEDYYIAQPALDERFILLPWDVNESFLVPYVSINAQQVPTVQRFLSYPAFALRYRAELKRQLETLMSPRAVHEMLREVRDVGEPAMMEVLRDFLAARPHEVAAQLHDRIRHTIRKPGPRYLIAPGASWRMYYNPRPPKGNERDWTGIDYNDSMENAWYDADMPMGFAAGGLLGEKATGTYIPHKADAPELVTLNARRRFNWEGTKPPENPRLLLRHSAGVIVYLNGVEIVRSMFGPGPVSRSQTAVAMNSSTTWAAFDLRPFARLFREGENAIAIETHMASLNDPRWVIDAVLVEGPPQVGTVVIGDPNLRLAGDAPVPPVAEIRAGDSVYPVDPWTARWNGDLGLNRGWNHVTLSGRSAEGDRVATTTLSLYHADSATKAPKLIDSDRVWTAKDSPYRISETLEIAPTCTLTLEKGTVVVIDPWVNVVCRGGLVAKGTAEQPVTIAGHDAGAPWGSIIGDGEKSRIILQFSNIRDCSNSVDPKVAERGYTLAGIEMWKGTLTADQCRVEDACGAAFGGGGGADVTLRHCRMERTGCGLMAWDSSWTVEDCVVIHTRNKGDGIDIDRDGPRPSVARRCVFADVDDDGIDLGGCSAVVEDCVIWGARDKGLSLDGGGTSTFKNCLIGDCDRAVQVKSHTTAILRQSAVLASRVGITTRGETDMGAGGSVEMEDCLVARCAVPFEGRPGCVGIRNVFVDRAMAEGPGSETLKGTATPGLIFANPEGGDWAVTSPMSSRAEALIGIPLDALLAMARRAGVELRETGLRLVETE